MLSILAVLWAQSAAAACVCAVTHMAMPTYCARHVGDMSAMAMPTAPAAHSATTAHPMRHDMGTGCLCPGHDASRTTVGGPSHPALTHAVAAVGLYVVADVQTLPVRRAIPPVVAASIQAIPPPHSILHCVFLI